MTTKNDGKEIVGRKGRHKQLICELAGFSDCIRGDGLEFEDKGVIYETPKRYAFTCRVAQALEESKTWGEFRQAMPHSEYTRLLHWDDGLEYEPRHKGSDAFNPDAIRAHEGGWYLSCLDDEIQAGALPADMFKKYVRLDGDRVGIASWEYVAATDVEEVNAELKRRGYEIIDYSGIPEEAEDRNADEEDDEDEP